MVKKYSITFIIIMLFSQVVNAQTSPVPMLEAIAQQIIITLKANTNALKNNTHIVEQTIRRYLLPKVDVIGMARSVLGKKAWSMATSSERQQFSEAFTKLIMRTYAAPLSEYTDESIKFFPIRGSLEKRFLQVKSIIIRTHGPNIPLSYSLISKNNNWKIYDFSVEGVSLLQSFRSQFAEALRSSNMQEIIKKMQQHSSNKKGR